MRACARKLVCCEIVEQMENQIQRVNSESLLASVKKRLHEIFFPEKEIESVCDCERKLPFAVFSDGQMYPSEFAFDADMFK